MQNHIRPTRLWDHIFEVHRFDSAPELFLNGSPGASASEHVASKPATQADAGGAIQENAVPEQAAE